MIEYYLPDLKLEIQNFVFNKIFNWKREGKRWYFYDKGFKTSFYLKLLDKEIEFHSPDKTIVTTFSTKKEAKEALKLIQEIK
ncbi:MAG: hypothetical protein LBD41_06870 [Clostridiales Family XIII bacterium]|jgi:hypothetical protein|nr:hypothetical protein [Clostridiales Family XIII bacterium]